MVATLLGLCLIANIAAGSNKANGIIPQKKVIPTAIAPSTRNEIPTNFALVFTAKVITNKAR